MHWLFLLLAIVFEVFGTTAMKLSMGFTRLTPSIAMLVLYLLSLSMLTLALRAIDVSLAYAVWSGLGTALIAVLGMTWFQEPVSLPKLFCIGLIVAGVMGLNYFGGGHTNETPLPAIASAEHASQQPEVSTAP